MSVVKVIEVLAQSEESWEDATKVAVKEASKTVKHIKNVYIKDFKAEVNDRGDIVYRVIAKISFLVE